jgi:hypothetical protein
MLTWLGYILEDLPESLKAVGLEGCPVGRREQHLVDYEMLVLVVSITALPV